MRPSVFNRQNLMAAGAVVLGIGLLGGLEVLEEPDMTPGEIAVELIEPTILVLTVAAVVYLMLRTQRQHSTQMKLLRSLSEARTKGSEWRDEMRELIGGLGQAINAQFDVWGLTPAEREVGLLLLKGLSLREIAVIRDASERTVRQQASAVYAKANLSGRAALSSYFLEDLLPPQKMPHSDGGNGARRSRHTAPRH